MSAVVVPEQMAVEVWADDGRVYLRQPGEGEEPDDIIELASQDAVRAVIVALQGTLS